MGALVLEPKKSAKEVEEMSHEGTWIAYKDCKCKYCKKARVRTRKIMSNIDEVLRKK